MYHKTPENNVTKHESPLPYLITRMGAGLIDLVFVLLTFIALQALSFQTVYHQLGYHSALVTAKNILADSGLFNVNENGEYLSLVDSYEEEADVITYYEVPLIQYFSTNPRAIKNNLLINYEQAKISSRLFYLDIDNQIKVADNTSQESLRLFFEIQIKKAIIFLENDPIYRDNAQKAFLITIFSYLTCGTLSFLIFYLLISLFTKDSTTIGQKLFKMGLMDVRVAAKATKNQVLVRFIVLVILNFWIPLLWYARVAYLSVFPILITLITIVLTKKNQGIHGMISATQIVSTRDVEIPKREIVKTIAKN